MMFALLVTNEKGEGRTFSFQPDTLEQGFEFISELVAKGNCLHQVRLIDKDSQTILPEAAFDGASFVSVVRQLEVEWGAILSRPPASSRPVKYWMQRRLAACHKRIDIQRRLLITLRGLLGQVPNLSAGEERKRLLTQRYGTALRINETQLLKSYLLRDWLGERLRRWEND
jgi:hypothetical protein